MYARSRHASLSARCSRQNSKCCWWKRKLPLFQRKRPGRRCTPQDSWSCTRTHRPESTNEATYEQRPGITFSISPKLLCCVAMQKLLSAYWFWPNRFAFRQLQKILRRRFENGNNVCCRVYRELEPKRGPERGTRRARGTPRRLPHMQLPGGRHDRPAFTSRTNPIDSGFVPRDRLSLRTNL